MESLSTTSAVLVVTINILFSVVTSQDVPGHLKHLQHVGMSNMVSVETQAAAVTDLVKRLIPDHATSFSLSVDPNLGENGLDTFQISSSKGVVSVKGTTGVATAWGVQHYLKYWCNAHVSWSGDQLNLSHPLPPVDGTVIVNSPHRYRYYQNACTSSYSFVWWNWTRWEREIDWMALNGINLPLAFTGQEEIWRRVYLQFNFTQSDLDTFFSGPAFLAWYRMGNIQGWAGPLPREWYTDQLGLQHKILQRMRSLGVIPVLPAFAGHVPASLQKLYPNASVTTLTGGRFTPPYCCMLLLDPTDPLFQEIGKQFISEMIKEFGTDHLYNADLFMEKIPKSNNVSYLSSTSHGLFKAMESADPKAIWLMQGWIFHHHEDFWQKPQMKAVLTGVPIGRMLVLDLFAEVDPQWQRTESFFGQPFIWCMLHNFGGNLGMYGAVSSVAKGAIEAMASKSTIVGTGLTPEGIEQNDVIYELMNEMGWRRQPVNVTDWVIHYATRRYGGFSSFVSSAWVLLIQGIYNCTLYYEHHCRAIPVVRPELTLNPEKWYAVADVYKAWDLMAKAAAQFVNSTTFRYDLVDLTRQVLQEISQDLYEQLTDAYDQKNVSGVRLHGELLLNLLDDMDKVLGTDEHYLLGIWLKHAKSLAKNDLQVLLYEFNARNQLTLWGLNGELHDYANKMWNGLVGDYYKSRWQAFIDRLESDLVMNVAFDHEQFENDDVSLGRVWTMKTDVYPDHPQGDTWSMVQAIHQKYRHYY